MIQQNKAALITSAKDVITLMEWLPKNKKPVQRSLFVDLSTEEQVLVDLLKAHGKVDIDTLCIKSNMPQGKAAGHLLNLEFSGVVRSLPGKMYALN